MSPERHHKLGSVSIREVAVDYMCRALNMLAVAHDAARIWNRQWSETATIADSLTHPNPDDLEAALDHHMTALAATIDLTTETKT